MTTDARYAMEALRKAVETLMPLTEPVVAELEDLKAKYRRSQDTLYEHKERADQAEAQLTKINMVLQARGHGRNYKWESMSTLVESALNHKARVYNDEIRQFHNARQAYETATMEIRRVLVNLVKMENEAKGHVMFGIGEKPDWLWYHEKINEAILLAAKHINPVPEVPKRIGE